MDYKELRTEIIQLIEDKNYVLCKTKLEKYSALEPNSSEACYLWALYYYKQQELTNANKHINTSISNLGANPADEVFLLATKITLILNADYNPKYLEKVSDMESGDYFLVRGMIAYKTNDFIEAEKFLEKSFRKNKKNFETNKYYAMTLYKLNPSDPNILKHLKKANKIDNEDEELIFVWIMYYYRNNMVNECKNKCIEVMRLRNSPKSMELATKTIEKLNYTEEKKAQSELEYQKKNKPSARGLSESLSHLNNLIGLETVKSEVNKLVSIVNFEKERARTHGIVNNEKSRISFCFYGNPGTGKTTVARLIGDILFNLEILESGHTVEVDRSTLVSNVIGGTEKLTFDKLEEAKGGVLFVDEAYTLSNSGSQNDFGPLAVETIMKYMEDNMGDIVVIFAGYYDEMQNFLKINPGIRSRMSNEISFQDYTDDEILEIGRISCKKKKYIMSENAEIAFKQKIAEKQANRYYANARDAEQLIEEATRNLALETQRKSEIGEVLSIDDYELIEARHFGVDLESSPLERVKRSLAELNKLVGLENAKKQVNRTISIVNHQQKIKLAGDQSNSMSDMSKHMIFIGNPGTGKTTVANYIAEIYKDMGILKSNKIVVKTPHDFIAKYIGQTAPITQDIIKDAYGGILFIDEAYGFTSSSNSGFGKEAVEILLTEMENNRDKLIIILAGYEKEMNDFLNMNSGLKSRIPHVIQFDDFSEEEALQIFLEFVKKNNLKIEEEAIVSVKEKISEIYENKDLNFGNARVIRNLFEEIYTNFTQRCITEEISEIDDLVLIRKSDVYI